MPDFESDQKELILSLKELINDFKLEIHDKKLFDRESQKMLKTVQECLASVKIQISKLETEQAGFIQTQRDRILNCDRIHSDHEQRLRQIPGGIRCKQNEKKLKLVEKKVEELAPLKRLESIEQKVDNFTPLLYKLVGGVTVIAIIIPPVISSLLNYFFKHSLK